MKNTKVQICLNVCVPHTVQLTDAGPTFPMLVQHVSGVGQRFAGIRSVGLFIKAVLK